MAFDPVVFGTYVVGTGYTAGDSIPTGGLRAFIVPAANIGDNALDVSITYVDQFGNSATTTVSTSVSAHTVAGAHIQQVLNNGDSGVRSISAVTVVGGTAGDTFRLESWNEGLGKTINMAALGERESNQQILDVRDHTVHQLIEDETEDAAVFSTCMISNLEVVAGKYRLQTEQIEPDYENQIEDDDGFLACTSIVDPATKKLRADLIASTVYQVVSAEYQRRAYIYNSSGFTKITFDYNVKLDSTPFILELVDDAGAVKWSKNGTANGTNQVVTFTSSAFTFRVRCKANYTSPGGTWSNWAQISNIRLDRFKLSGYLQQTRYKYRNHLKKLSYLRIAGILGIAGTNIQAQMDVGDSIMNTTGWVGPGGSSAAYYRLGGNAIYTGGDRGAYWRSKVTLKGDGRYTPEFDYFEYTFYIYHISRELAFPEVTPITINIPVAFHPFYSLLARWGTFSENNTLPLSGVQAPGKVYALLEGEQTTNMQEIGLIFGKIARQITLFSSWSESTVGTVMSGYLRDQNDQIITGGKKIILESTYVFGRDTMGAVNAETGFYQVFVKEAKYDRRHLIIEYPGKPVNISLTEHGDPAFVDATVGDVPNQDLHFWKSPVCTTVAHVDSLVTY